MNYDHQSRFEVITGQKGYGKTTFAYKLLKNWKHKYLFVFDRRREFARKNKLKSCVNPKQMVWCVQHKYPVVFDYSAMFPSNPQEGFDFFLRWVYAVSQALTGIKLIYCDEIQFAVDYSQRKAPHSIAEVSDDGRKEEIDCLFIVNGGYNYLHHEIRKQATKVYIFHTEEFNCIKKLKQDGISADSLAKLNKLKIGEYVTKP